MAQHFGIGNWFFDPVERFMGWDAEMFELFGVARENDINALPLWEQALTQTVREEFYRQLAGPLDSHQPLNRVIPIQRPDGRIAWLHLIAQRDQDSGCRRCIYGAARDVTREHEMSEELAHARHAAEAASRAKRRFLDNINHEIRTPLNAISGMIYTLEQSQLSETHGNQLNTIRGASGNLQTLISNLIDLSKIETGDLIFEQSTFLLEPMLAELRQMFRGLAANKGLELILDTQRSGNPLPQVVVGDETRLRQILSNLLSNAIKFTRSGKVELIAEPIQVPQRDPLSLWVGFTVRDTGIGIPRAEQERLFQPFTQIDDSNAREFGGCGLGLTMVRRLTEGMGGKLELKSDPDWGSSFRIELPFAAGQIEDLPIMDYGQLRQLHILILDDLDWALEHHQTLIERLGWHADTVDNGEAMIERVLTRHRNGNPYDCLLVDWKMPGLRGTEVLRRLADQLGDQMPAVIMVTSDDIQRLHDEPDSAIADAILQKPMQASELFNRVNQAMLRHKRELDHLLNATSLETPRVLWLYDTRILVVDDNDLNRDVCKRILETQGAQVSTTQNGREAIDLLHALPGDFDLVLLDLHMPVLDGCATARRIRSDEQLKNLPLVALTAGAASEETHDAFEAGMDQVVTKPINPSQLVRTLRHRIEVARNKPLRVMPLTEVTPTRSEPFPEIAGINCTELAGRLGGDIQLLRHLLQPLVGQLYEQRYQVLRMIVSELSEEAAEQLHAIRGQTATLGANDLASIAKRLELSLREGRNEPPLLMEFLETSEALEQAMSRWLAQDGAARLGPAAVVGAGNAEQIAGLVSELLAHTSNYLIVEADQCNQDLLSQLTDTQRTQYQPVADALGALRYDDAYAALRDFLATLDLPLADDEDAGKG